MAGDSLMRVAVIGSGLGGLAAAITLAARGYQVSVFEKNDWLGGKAAVLQEDGSRFDMGPTILIRPSVLRRIFTEAGRRLEDYLTLVRLDPQWRCFFDDGLILDLEDNLQAMAGILDGIRPGMGAGFLRFQQLSEQLHSISEKFFFWRPVGSMMDTLDLKGAFSIAVLRDVMRMRLGQTVAGTFGSLFPMRGWRRCWTTTRSMWGLHRMLRRRFFARSGICCRKRESGIRWAERGLCRRRW
jgi:diapolycopene oxygenase